MRDLASRSGRRLIELNFEREPRLARYFESNDPNEILGEPADLRISHSTTQGNPVSFRLVSLPIYMTFALSEVLAA